jgi:hypothetical protein
MMRASMPDAGSGSMPKPKTQLCQDRAKSAADAARLASETGNLEISAVLRELETIWLRLAQHMETLEQEVST